MGLNAAAAVVVVVVEQKMAFCSRRSEMFPMIAFCTVLVSEQQELVKGVLGHY